MQLDFSLKLYSVKAQRRFHLLWSLLGFFYFENCEVINKMESGPDSGKVPLLKMIIQRKLSLLILKLNN
jgi:hypothetical protein